MMDMSTNKEKMSSLNFTRALIRIYKELVYIRTRSPHRLLSRIRLFDAAQSVTEAIRLVNYIGDVKEKSWPKKSRAKKSRKRSSSRQPSGK